ncbi:WD40 repeat domain-containing protein [Endozoicomonas gorgoniicola]|uniref:WD40 repeat domain-containing protein n=1 Tax=Endozoicomonas gorgoniicola TaxID=1234144 RepID=A0ABT3MUN6_9GAMM|nr:WD40 repeat domain-containing protein [Endozoicomonas gorgoniicola]MCW7553069.1 WD40 repeat domain-containing protein [Endozoicomonas gorgoniicola]
MIRRCFFIGILFATISTEALSTEAFSTEALASPLSTEITELWHHSYPNASDHRPSEKINLLAFSPDGQLLSIISNHKTVRVVAANNPNSVLFESEFKYPVLGASFRGDTQQLIVTDARTTRIIDFTRPVTDAPLAELKHKRPVRKVATSPDGDLLVTGNANRKVYVFNITKHNIFKAREVVHMGSKIKSINISPDNRFMIIGNSDSKGVLVDISNHAKFEYDATIDFGYQYGYSYSKNKLMDVYPLKFSVENAAFSQNSQFVATEVNDRILISDLFRPRKPITQNDFYLLGVNRIALSADGHYLIAGKPGHGICVYRVSSNIVFAYSKTFPIEGDINTMAIHHEQCLLAVGGDRVHLLRLCPETPFSQQKAAPSSTYPTVPPLPSLAFNHTDLQPYHSLSSHSSLSPVLLMPLFFPLFFEY